MSAYNDAVQFFEMFYFLIVLIIDPHAASRDALSLRPRISD